MLYSQLCNKYSDKSNQWNLGLSLTEATSAVGAINSCPPSVTLCIASHRVALIIFLTPQLCIQKWVTWAKPPPF